MDVRTTDNFYASTMYGRNIEFWSHRNVWIRAECERSWQHVLSFVAQILLFEEISHFAHANNMNVTDLLDV